MKTTPLSLCCCGPLLAACLALAACTTGNTEPSLFGSSTPKAAFHEDQTPIIESNDNAADELISGLDGDELPEGSPVYVQPFANRLNPADTAIFGQVVADQVAARMAQKGLHVMDGGAETAKLNPNAAPAELPEEGVSPEGAPAPEAQGVFSSAPVTPRPALLAGTYLVGEDVVWITAKVVRLDDHVVISSASWTLPINDNTRTLLPAQIHRDGSEPSVRTSF